MKLAANSRAYRLGHPRPDLGKDIPSVAWIVKIAVREGNWRGGVGRITVSMCGLRKLCLGITGPTGRDAVIFVALPERTEEKRTPERAFHNEPRSLGSDTQGYPIMTYSMAARMQRANRVFALPSLRTWLLARQTEQAINRLDDRLRVDIGLPPQGFRHAPPNHVAARISMMAWR